MHGAPLSLAPEPEGRFRIDLAKAILKEEGDETKLFSFNVGTQF